MALPYRNVDIVCRAFRKVFNEYNMNSGGPKSDGGYEWISIVIDGATGDQIRRFVEETKEVSNSWVINKHKDSDRIEICFF